MAKQDWGAWIPLPPPDRFKAEIEGPAGPGVYQLRHRTTKELILFGAGVDLAVRLRALMPSPYGTGTRDAAKKREYVLAHHAVLDYRLHPTDSHEQAKALEGLLKSDGFHKFKS